MRVPSALQVAIRTYVTVWPLSVASSFPVDASQICGADNPAVMICWPSGLQAAVMVIASSGVMDRNAFPVGVSQITTVPLDARVKIRVPSELHAAWIIFGSLVILSGGVVSVGN